jgi:DNA-binding NarL/FixJ family response regulator
MAGANRKDIFFFGRELQPRTVWAGVLRQHKASVHHFTEPAACLDRLFQRPCDLLIVDFNGFATEARELLVGAKRACPWVSSVAVVDHGDTAAAVMAMKAGAADCLERPIDRDRLSSAVETALDRPHTPACHARLTQTETQVLHLILAGMTNHDIARVSHRSRRTIEAHRRNIMRKLGVSDIVGLVKEATMNGYFELPDGGSPDSPQKGTPTAR